MNKSTLINELGQLPANEVQSTFESFIRGSVRNLISGVMAEEVSLLCGAKHHPNDSDYKRAGTSPGLVLLDGESVPISKPRVRKTVKGKTTETVLSSYTAAQNTDKLHEQILLGLTAGVSTRDQKKLKPQTKGISKSQVSRLWVEAGGELLTEFRSIDIAKKDWVALMLDGIFLAKETVAICALGIDSDGRKHMLDFQLGSSENLEVCKGLMQRLKDRDFEIPEERRLLAVLDGSKALEGAVLAYFPNAVIQRCLIHKERNLKGYLPRKYHPELRGYFDRLRKAQGLEAAKEIYKELYRFVKSRNAQATNSLLEAGDTFFGLYRLEVPSTLNTTFLNTNVIENSYRNVRAKIGKVSRWRDETMQAPRWLALALTEAQKGFRQINAHEDIPELIKALNVDNELTALDIDELTK